MNIFKTLNNILDSYNIKISGETYQDIINEKVRSIIFRMINEDKKVAIRGAGEHTTNLLKLVPELKVEYIFDRNVSDEEECIINHKRYKLKPDNIVNNIDCVIISSFAHRKKMTSEIKELDESIEIIDIYEILNNNGFCVNEPFFKITRESYESFIYYRNKYEEENTPENLKSVIKSSVDICDFINFYNYCNIYINNKYEGYKEVFNAKHEVEKLFFKVKEIIQARDSKDIVMIWNDQVGYSELPKMKYVYKMSKKSLFFKKAYTMTPFTYPVFMEMFQNLKSLDDNIYTNQYPKINYDNSKFLKRVEDAGYNFVYIGDESDGSLFANVDVITKYTYGSSNVRALEMLQKLICDKRPLFILLHALVETHNPYLSADLNIPIWYEWPYFQGDSQECVSMQADVSLKYWDKQLEYYMNFLGENAIKIFMSDHGKRFGTLPIYHDVTTHVLCFVTGKNIPNVKYNKVFSLFDFNRLVKAILSEDYNQDKICSDMIFFQETAIFNKTAIRYYIERECLEASMAFRAVRTENELFVRISNGTEHYYINGDEANDRIFEKCYESRVNYLRNYVSNNFDKAALNQEMLELFRDKYETHE